jgi:hypothetical protein
MFLFSKTSYFCFTEVEDAKDMYTEGDPGPETTENEEGSGGHDRKREHVKAWAGGKIPFTLESNMS